MCNAKADKLEGFDSAQRANLSGVWVMNKSQLNAIEAVQNERLDKWEAFRTEMESHQKQLAKLAASFLELGAFEDAAKCAIKAEGIKHVIGRMPLSEYEQI